MIPLRDYVSHYLAPVTSTRPVRVTVTNASMLRLKDVTLLALSCLLAVSLLMNAGQVVVFDAATERIEDRAAEQVAYQRRLHTLTLAALHRASERLETAAFREMAMDARETLLDQRQSRYEAHRDILRAARDKLALRDVQHDHEVIGIALQAAEMYGLDWYEAGQLAEAE